MHFIGKGVMDAYSGALGFDDFNQCIDDEYLALFITVESIYKIGVEG